MNVSKAVRPFLIMLICILPMLSFAGGEVGNGGDVVVCPKSVELFDIYEARIVRKYKLSLGAPNLPVNQKIQIGIKRLLKVDPFRARMIEIQVPLFNTNTMFVRNSQLTNIPDTNGLFIPENCTLEQIAIQNKKTINGDPDFIVNEDLWDRLDNDNKAALILHETIFSLGDQRFDSGDVRLLNSYMFSSFVEDNEYPNDSRPNKYFHTIKGSSLEERVEIFQISSNPRTPNDQRWFFQIPDPKKTIQSVLLFLSRRNVAAELIHECNLRDGKPINRTELKKVAAHLDYLFGGHRPGTMPIWVKDGDKVALIYPDSGVEEKLENVSGEVWCVGDKDPWSSN